MAKSETEMAFLVNVQVMELYFGLIVHELRGVQRDLRVNRLAEAKPGPLPHGDALPGTQRHLDVAGRAEPVRRTVGDRPGYYGTSGTG